MDAAAKRPCCGPSIDLHYFIVDNDPFVQVIDQAMRALGAAGATLVSKGYGKPKKLKVRNENSHRPPRCDSLRMRNTALRIEKLHRTTTLLL